MVYRVNLNDSSEMRMAKRFSALEAQAPVGSTSITKPGSRLRVESDGGIVAKQVAGGAAAISVQGRQSVSGQLDGSGNLAWTGPTSLNGATTIGGNVTTSGTFTNTGTFTNNGATKLNGTVDISGAATLNNDLSVGTGKIVVGSMTLDKLGTGGAGRVVATGQLALQGNTIYLGASTTVNGPLGVSGFTNLNGLAVTGSKSFVMPHPLRPGWLLLHGATESPVSGVEYWGEATLTGGSAVVDLPDYFDALVKPGTATVLVTGRGFSPSWTDVDGCSFVVTGKAGGKVSWLVKAERIGGDFVAETPADDSPAEAFVTAAEG